MYQNMKQNTKYNENTYENNESYQNKCQKLIENNEYLTYTISIMQQQLNLLKTLQNDKIYENNKIKEKIRMRLIKQQQIKKHMKLQKDRINKLIKGFKNINKQHENQINKQTEIRDIRICNQQQKNGLYQKYEQIENVYKNLLINIQKFSNISHYLKQAQSTNIQINQQIRKIQKQLNEQKPNQNINNKNKKQRIIKMKQFNSKIIQLQQQQKNINIEIQQIKLKQNLWQNQRNQIQNLSAQNNKLYQRINEHKNILISKKLELTQMQSLYKQLCIEETKIKKQILLEQQCREQQIKYKQAKNTPKNKLAPIPQQISNQKYYSHSPEDAPSSRQVQSMEKIMKKFQNLKNKYST